ncbi:hypothetical protein, partial [Moraxella caprae]
MFDSYVNSKFSPVYHKNPHQRHEDNGGGRVERGGSLGIYTKLHANPENKGFAGVKEISSRVKNFALQ